MNELWELMQAVAKTSKICDRVLGTPLADDDAEPVIATVRRIFAVERDHLAALEYLYDATTKGKADTTMADFAREAVKDYREKSKLIK